MDILEQALGLPEEPCKSPTSCARKSVKPAAKKAAAKNDFPWLIGGKPGSDPIGSPNLAALDQPYPKDTPDVDNLGKGDYGEVAKTGLGALAGLFTALGVGDDAERSKYDLPGAGGADMPALAGVDKPFQGRMDMSPEQRQSLALTLLR